jgi:hypothetical protein
MKFIGAVFIGGRGREGRRKVGVQTKNIHAEVVTGETVVLRKFAGMKEPR